MTKEGVNRMLSCWRRRAKRSARKREPVILSDSDRGVVMWGGTKVERDGHYELRFYSGFSVSLFHHVLPFLPSSPSFLCRPSPIFPTRTRPYQTRYSFDCMDDWISYFLIIVITIIIFAAARRRRRSPSPLCSFPF